MASHNLEQASRLCPRALVLVSGRLVGDLVGAQLNADRLADLYRAPLLVTS